MCVFSIVVYPLDIGLRVTPYVSLPIGNESSSVFSVGGGALLNAEIDLFRHLSVGPEFGFNLSALNGPTGTVQFYHVGPQISAFAYPASRVVTRIGASFGLYEAFASGSSQIYTYLRAFGEAGFRISPALSLSASGGYISYRQAVSGNLCDSLMAGVSVRYLIDTKSGSGDIIASLEQTDSVFPLFFGMYRTNSVGTLRIRNEESAEIRNVKVSFGASGYTASRMPCATVPYLAKGRTIDVPLYADFSPSIFNFTEQGKMPGEVRVEYELLGATRETAVSVILDVNNRNSVRWTDPNALAAFCAPNAPEVLDLGKYLVGIARGNLRTGLNRNMQFAMYMFEGLRAGGLTWSNDESTPYARYHLEPELLDFIQYPFQTLAYRSGDYDDMGLLFASLLESVGIKAALIPVDGDFIVAFSLGITPEEAQAYFSNEINVLPAGDEAWIPLSMAYFREGFVNSWYSAVMALEPALRGEASIEMIVLRDSWQSYPPASIAGNEAKFDKPAEKTITKAVDTALLRYVSAEFGPKIQSVQRKIRESGGTTDLYSELGLLYVRAGMYPEAKGEYKKAASMGSVSANVNLGNLALLERDYREAERHFRDALRMDPASKAAKSGLDRALVELEE